jgi:hypothetical protein
MAIVYCNRLELIFVKSLKIPKVKSEVINRRRTDNTMVEKKKDKYIDNDIQNITPKAKD